MACYQPIRAFQRESGARVQLLPARGQRGEPSNLELPCGKCLGCQQTRATIWAERCKHHARQFRNCSFLTLTYNDTFRPTSVEPRHLQLFIKRLRKRVSRVLARAAKDGTQRNINHRILSNPRKPLSYFACAEYGEETGRPHYHALIFNADFHGLRIGAEHGHELRINDHIAACWTDPKTKESYGNHTLGTATASAVAGYIAKYVLKSHRYNTLNNPICDRDGVFNENWIRPPFIRLSKGIGNHWLERYHTDLSHGYITDSGRKQRIPRYYQKKLKGSVAQAIHLRSYLQHLHSLQKITQEVLTSSHTTPSASPHEGLAKNIAQLQKQLQLQEAYQHTAMAIEHYQHIYQHLNKDTDKNTEQRRLDAQRIHEQKHNNQRRRDL